MINKNEKIERYIGNLNEQGLKQSLRFLLKDNNNSNKGFILQCVEDNAIMYPKLEKKIGVSETKIRFTPRK